MLRAECLLLDQADPLRDLRTRYLWDEASRMRFDANSVGPMSVRVAKAFGEVSEQWRVQSRRGWSECGWFEAPLRIGDKLASLLGAAPGQVVVADSTSINLHKVLSLAMDMCPEGGIILTQAGGFPTDFYVAQGLVEQRPEFRLQACEGDEDRLRESIRPGVSIVYLSHTDYRTGLRLDMAALSRAAREAGALCIFDLSHSAGAGKLALDECQVDFAVGCGYKYLACGPGAPGYLYVARRHQGRRRPAPWGWMGHASPLSFEDSYRPHPGMRSHLVGTPAVVGNALFEASMDSWAEIDLDAAWARRAALADTFIRCLDALRETLPEALRPVLVTPREAHRQGGFMAIRHSRAEQLCVALEARGVLVSFRPPDVIRFGLSPLVHRHVDVRDAMTELGTLLNLS